MIELQSDCGITTFVGENKFGRQNHFFLNLLSILVLNKDIEQNTERIQIIISLSLKNRFIFLFLYLEIKLVSA